MRHATKSLRSAMAVTLALGFATVACDGNGGNGPNGDMGFVSAAVVDNPASPNTSPAMTSQAEPQGASASQYEGTIRGDMAVEISADGVVWYELGAPAQVAVQAQHGNGTTVHTEVTVPEGQYVFIRLRMENAQAELHAGAVIGSLTLSTDITVMINNGAEVVIEKQVPAFTVSADASVRTEIVLDLNSELWITEGSVESGSAEEAEVEEATTAETHEAPR